MTTATFALCPVGERVIVRAVGELARASGIVIPDIAKERPSRGVVVAVGDGRVGKDGEHIPLEIAAGDEVLYSKYGGTEIQVEGENLTVLRESVDIIARIEA